MENKTTDKAYIKYDGVKPILKELMQLPLDLKEIRDSLSDEGIKSEIDLIIRKYEDLLLLPVKQVYLSEDQISERP